MSKSKNQRKRVIQRPPIAPPPIVVPTGELAAVAKWAGTDPNRPHLSVVIFEKGHYVALDGHRLVRVPCKTHNYRLLIGAEHVFAAVAAQRALLPGHMNNNRIEISPSANPNSVHIRISEHVTMHVPAAIDQFPPYLQVIPKGPTTTDPNNYRVNPRYIAAIAEVMENVERAPNDSISGDLLLGVRIVAWGTSTEPLLFESANGIQFVVMPMRM